MSFEILVPLPEIGDHVAMSTEHERIGGVEVIHQVLIEFLRDDLAFGRCIDNLV